MDIPPSSSLLPNTPLPSEPPVSTPVFPTPVQNLQEPIVILSDVHIGLPSSKVNDPLQLAPLIQGAGTVIFNGDTVEMRTQQKRSSAIATVEQLKKICAAYGATPIFINGNHDPVISTINQVELWDSRILITHGDILFHKISPWSWEGDVVGEEHTRLLNELESADFVDFEKRLFISKKASLIFEMHEHRFPMGRTHAILSFLKEFWPPWRPFQVLKYWADTPKLAVQLSETFRPHAEIILIGHTHLGGIWQLHNKTIINTGSFLPFSGCFGVQIHNGYFAVREILEKNGKFKWGIPHFACHRFKKKMQPRIEV